MMRKKSLKMRKTKKTKKVKMMMKQKNQRNMMKRSMKRCNISFPVYKKLDPTHRVLAVSQKIPHFSGTDVARGVITLIFFIAQNCVLVNLSVLDLILPKSSEKGTHKQECVLPQ